MKYLPQSLIVVAERGQDLAEIGRSFATEKNDHVIELLEHKKENGTTVGIFVDDIRMLRELVRTAKKGTRTLVIIADAAKMQIGAQNALLKLLEEPRENLHLLLLTPTPEQLSVTILSRCQRIDADAAVAAEIPEEKRAKVSFMAGDNQAEMNKLATDEKYFAAQSELFEQAKIFFGAKKYQRLTVIASVKDSRDKALELLRASLTFGNFMLRSNHSPNLQQQVKRLLEADDAIRKNGNVRLWLLKTVV